MKKFLVVPVAFTLALGLAATLGARTTDAPATIPHTHVAGVSDPDPADCVFCGGNPQLHVRIVWEIQKIAVQTFEARFL